MSKKDANDLAAEGGPAELRRVTEAASRAAEADSAAEVGLYTVAQLAEKYQRKGE